MRAKGNKWLIQILSILVILVIIKLAFLYYDGVKHNIKTNKEDPNKTVLNKAVEEIENETNGNVEYKEEDEEKKEDPEEKTDEKTDKNKNCDRWIVITSISEPTEHVKYVQDALFEWCLIVVGDSKSPPNWKYKDAIFLSLQDQINLGRRYSIVEEIPTKSYLRKMVGYLYAIDHGAKYIYETDDDNSALDGLLGFKYMRYRGLEMDCQAENMFVNPYAYFGQPSVWPRGYPLEMISETAVSANCSKFTVSTKMPLIQQGLVNGDPDVDAIYRLTRKQPSKLLYIEFDGNAPSLLLKNRQYAPTNSQNTFFHYDSFWTLIFPRNVTFREVDILRGYIGIRMLQEIDARVAYLSPNAVQIRNAHSYHKDYLQETRLYDSIQRFVVDLDQWTCDKAELKECFIDCIQMLVDKKHLCKSEVDFFRLWIKDLDSIGYKWPKINSNRAKGFILKKQTLPITVYFKALEQDHSSNSNDNEKSIVQRQSQETKIAKIKSICQLLADKSIDLDKINKINDIILVTWINSAEDLDIISNVLNIHFSFIIGCFPTKIDKLSNINNYIMSNTSGGITLIDATSFQQCVFNAVNIGFKQNTFIFAKTLNKFEFWSNATKLIDSSDKINFFELDNNPKNEELFDKNVYFVRKTVANGQKILDLGSSSSTSFNLNSYCSIYSSELYKSIVKSLQETVQSLNWHSNDLVGESCSNIDSRTIWIPDFHDGPRVDLSSTLVYLGQNPILAGSKGTSSVYPNALMLSKISSQLSNYVKNYNAESNRKLSKSSVRENFEFYKSSSDFINVDSIICSFTAVICEAFIPLNKTIIFNPAHRYNIGRCNKDSWTRLNENYNKLKARSKLVVSAMSKYDEEYQAHFTGLRGYKLYAHGTFYGKNIEYNPVKKEILVGPTNGFGADGEKWFQEIQNLSKDSQLIFRKIRELYPHYELSELAKHPAIVIFPYSVMSYSIIDYYVSNIPIFVPSIEILTKSKSVYDRSIYFEAYCGKIEPIQPCSTSKHLPFDPNSDEDADYSYWLQFSDYYRWPYVTVFNSWADLFKKLQTVDLKQISNSMREFNKVRQAYVLDNWCRIIKSLPKEQPIPKSLEEALSYFNMKTVQTY